MRLNLSVQNTDTKQAKCKSYILSISIKYSHTVKGSRGHLKWKLIHFCFCLYPEMTGKPFFCCLVSIHLQFGFFWELPGANMQHGLWLQSQQRKYINTKPLASLFSLVNISNTLQRGSCFQSPLCWCCFSDGPGANCSATAGKSSAPLQKKKWLRKHGRTRQNAASFGLRGRPCRLPTRIQFAFGLQRSGATNIGFDVGDGSNIYKPREVAASQRRGSSPCRRNAPLYRTYHSPAPAVLEPFFIRDAKKFINRATWHSELRIQGWSSV